MGDKTKTYRSGEMVNDSNTDDSVTCIGLEWQCQDISDTRIETTFATDGHQLTAAVKSNLEQS